ncbi:pumilio homology domain family member [Anaeramoeba flamelloides]|uniref:Pumilio homology domain family member n=1 Tax=Anaeramoeba flamelloides TaxID=1746091 RepID=A0AAV7ZBM6_9EUKA|nr:pumilio homology domain family member [Anaeramoeba flamelloides]
MTNTIENNQPLESKSQEKEILSSKNDLKSPQETPSKMHQSPKKEQEALFQNTGIKTKSKKPNKTFSPPKISLKTEQILKNSGNKFSMFGNLETKKDNQNSLYKYNEFPIKKHLETPKRRMLRTSQSSESLISGNDFDLYRKFQNINLTSLNSQNLFAFDTSFSNSFSNNQQPRDTFNLNTIFQQQNQTQQQDQQDKEKPSLTRTFSMFSTIPSQSNKLDFTFNNTPFLEKNQQLNKPTQINKVKKKSMLRVRSFDQILPDKPKSLVKSQTTHNVKMPNNNFDKSFLQNNGFSPLSKNYSKNISTNKTMNKFQYNPNNFGFKTVEENSNNFGFKTVKENKKNFGLKKVKENSKNFSKSKQFYKKLPNEYNNYKETDSSPISEYIGNIYKTCQNQYGCRVLQGIIETSDERTIGIVFSELRNHFEDLMKDQFGNYLCQKLFQLCSEDCILKVLIEIEQVIIPISTNLYGTRAIQKLIENITTEKQEKILFNSFSKNLIALINNANGNHVVQKCFIKFSQEKNLYIFKAIVENYMIIAGHKHGCCVMQRCIDFAPRKYRDALTGNIIKNVVKLIQNPFANYVIQYMLNTDICSEDIIESVKGKMINLSIQKFSSNVVEKCLRVANDKTRKILIDEFINNPDSMKTLLMDNYANYAVQTALKLATPNQLKELTKIIRPLVPYIRNSSCLKKIQSLISKDKNSMIINNNINNNNNNNNNNNYYNNNNNNKKRNQRRFQQNQNSRNQQSQNNQRKFNNNRNSNNQNENNFVKHDIY